MYFLVGKSQFFLGKKSEYDDLNLQNLRRGIRMADGTFDKAFTKYLKGIQEHARYLPTDERIEYLGKRIADLDAVLEMFRDKNK